MKNFEVSKDLGVKQVIHLNKTDKVFYDDLQLNDVSYIELTGGNGLQVADIYSEHNIRVASVADIYSKNNIKIASIETKGKVRIIADYGEQSRIILIETTY